MGFKSEASKAQAVSSINKLLGNVLPTAQPVSITGNQEPKDKQKKQVSIQTINETFYGLENSKLTPQELLKLKKKKKAAKKQLIRRQRELNSKVQKEATINNIKKHINKVESQSKGGKSYEKKDYQLEEDEKKLVNSLIDRNVEVLKSWENSGLAEAELGQLQNEILVFKNAGKEIKQRQNKKRTKEFSMEQKINGKIRRGHAFPGLTPGLAPVGLEDSDDEESD